MLELAVVGAFLLDGIIGEMHKFIGKLFQVVLLAGRSSITILIPISLQDSIYSCHQDEIANVEFPLVEEERFLHVFLDYHRAAILASLLHQTQDFLQIVGNCYACTSVRVLARLANPHVSS